MSRWRLAWIPPILCCLAILIWRPIASGALQDSDTAFLLSKIRERNAPLSWFAGDWPLENHFYRPVSTLTFEFDNAIHGNAAGGYIWTNCLLVVGCILSLCWLVKELFDEPALVCIAGTAFGIWCGPWQPDWLQLRLPVCLVIGVVGLLRHGWRIDRWAPAVCVVAFLATELARPPLYSRVAGWLPGRTASVMTVFVLIALAAYARYERCTAERRLPPPSPLDPPGRTRDASRRGRTRPAWPLLVIALLATSLALGSYEQAVMLPALFVAVAYTLLWQGFRVRWKLLTPAFALLVGYLLLRHAVIPGGSSAYQKQQFRSGPGLWGDLLGYIFPGYADLNRFWISVQTGLEMLVVATPWLALFGFISNVVAYVAATRAWIVALAGWGMSLLAYLPMAWLKWFAHYEFLPYAFRAILVAGLAVLAVRLSVSAWSRPAIQSPPRLVPAPGSLPHL